MGFVVLGVGLTDKPGVLGVVRVDVRHDLRAFSCCIVHRDHGDPGLVRERDARQRRFRLHRVDEDDVLLLGNEGLEVGRLLLDVVPGIQDGDVPSHLFAMLLDRLTERDKIGRVLGLEGEAHGDGLRTPYVAARAVAAAADKAGHGHRPGGGYRR